VTPTVVSLRFDSPPPPDYRWTVSETRELLSIDEKDTTMLVLKRKEGQWVDVTHSSGDILRIRVCQIESGQPGHLNLAFDDSARNFAIERPERKQRLAEIPPAVSA
jgi:hypothetical protein